MRLTRYLAGACAALVIAAGVAAYFALRSSLPLLSGEVTAPVHALQAGASIERDAAGTPTIRAQSRPDLAFATGFAHAQDRYFQMDLMRRSAAGELAELLGPAMVGTDKRLRLHDFRHVAANVVAASAPADRAILDAYVAGVNAGLDALRVRPWEYFLLRSRPQAWRAEDSLLVAFSMYLSLNDSTGADELSRAALHDSLPAPMFAFLHPYGTSWDAPLAGGTWRAPEIPGAEIFDLRRQASAHNAGADSHVARQATQDFVGSNSWAVDGSHAADGHALLANDMHLQLRLPHVWYRARMLVEGAAEQRLDLVGVTLPGMPMLLVGSNGHVAWGFTNSYGDWTDVVIAEPDPARKDRYFYSDGSEPFRVRHETIRVRGAQPVEYAVRTTRWGPVFGEDKAGRSLVLAWTAQHARASNLHLLELERARNIDQVLDAANRSGAPVQNFIAVDSTGRIGWTLLGQVPVRTGYDSSLPSSWRAPGTGWVGWRTPAEYPRIVDPPAGRLWTANARAIEAQRWLEFLGDGGYDLGARAAQIRDGLLSLNRATTADMRNIQLDDRALFLNRWRDLLLSLLTSDAVRKDERRAQALQLISNWSGRASVDDAGYRIVRAFRLRVRDDVYEALVSSVIAKYPQLDFAPPEQFEGPLWQMVSTRPPHLLPPRFTSWNDALLYALDRVLSKMERDCGALSTCTWGRQNTLLMQHPLSLALPWLAHWLDMPREALPGDANMPRVQGPTFGASERIVVSPGHEAQGVLQMPGGPVDHPLSPFYGAGHEAWVRGRPQPLLPGATRYTLRLTSQH